MLSYQDPVHYAVNIALCHHSYLDAIFLAERLYAEVASENSLYLLATCYYRAGRRHQAYALLKRKASNSPQCKYLLGKCCFDLNKLSEAELVLGGEGFAKSRNVEHVPCDYGETTPYVLALLGDIYKKTERHAQAFELYRESLRQNPFMWSSFASLCQSGETIDPSAVFHISNAYSLLRNVQQPAGQARSLLQPSTNAAAVIAAASSPRSSLQSLSLSQDCLAASASIPLPMPGGEITSAPLTATASSVLPSQPLPSYLPGIVSHTPEDISGLAYPHHSTSADQVTHLQKINSARLGCGLLTSPLASSGVMDTPLSGFGALAADTPSPCTVVNSVPFVTPAIGYPLVTELHPSAPIKRVVAVPKKSCAMITKPVFSQSATNARQEHDTSSGAASPTAMSSSLHYNVQAVRRSSRIFANQNSSSVKENNNKGQIRSKICSSTTSQRLKSHSSKSEEELNELNKHNARDSRRASEAQQQQIEGMQRQSAASLLSLLRDIGEGYLALQQYHCKKAVDVFSKIPAHHYKTGWLLSQVGRAFFELADYRKAEEIFKEVRQIAPFRVDDMEMFSTALWHLQKDVALSTLALELGDVDRNAPETWCVRGNCFSLQKEHDAAIKFFQRAIQVDPEFSYAYTLLGHEYTLVEDFDKAMSCFRNAIRIDPRRYNAWYGVGLIYYKQEKFSLAEAHFKKALSINPQSPVLLCHIGVVQHALSKPDIALGTLNKALIVDPKNPLCKFHKATVLLAKNCLQEALRELEELRDIEPRESLVYFLMGKVHKKLGNSHLALLNFSWAMDLDPKGANNHIKEAIDKRYVTDDEDLLSSPEATEDVANDNSGGLAATGGTASSAAGSLMEADEDAHLQASESDESL